MKFLSSENLKKVFSIVKGWIDALETKLTSAIDSKISGQKFKTVNGEAITGEGNIAIDLSLYKVVISLPTADIDTNKIYLVAKSGAPEGDVYTEHVYVNGKWEKLGEYHAGVDLTPYVKTADMNTALAGKADKDTMTAELGKKANAAEVYSKTDVDTALEGKLSADDMTEFNAAEIEAIAAEVLDAA